MRDEPTAWALLVRAILEHAVARGLERASLLDAVGLDEASLARPEARVPLAAHYALVERAADTLDDPGFGLAAAVAMGDDALGALGFLGMTSATLGDALRAMIALHGTDGERYELAVEGRRAHLRYLPWGPPRPAHAVLGDLFLADTGVNVPPMVEGGIDGTAAVVRGDAARAARVSAALGVPVTDGGAIDALAFDAASLDRPMRRADPAMRVFFEGYLRERVGAPTSTVADRVRAVVDARLPDGPLAAASIAAALGASVRTLQRSLRADGTTLSALIRERRLARAQALLDAGKSMSEAAYEAGYSEASALHRALRRSTLGGGGRPPDPR